MAGITCTYCLETFINNEEFTNHLCSMMDSTSEGTNAYCFTEKNTIDTVTCPDCLNLFPNEEEYYKHRCLESPYDKISHPQHYNSHPSGIECITITEHMTFNVGNVFKYLWRAGLKNAAPMKEDFLKARWYLDREIKRLFGDN